MLLQKDAVLDQLARHANVAQFVSYRQGKGQPVQSFSRVRGREPNVQWDELPEAIAYLLSASGSGMVNVRSYLPHDPQSREFVYGLKSVAEAVSVVQRLHAEGLDLIVNETIDVSDGGVSGVVQGWTIEFAPDDTPRCVEKPGVASLPFEMGISLLATVYGFRPDLTAAHLRRTEFSIHPSPQGWQSTHTLLWEAEGGVQGEGGPTLRWPNRFSRHIGDKAFGLLMADQTGQNVPRSLVIPRRVRPFEFGTTTGSAEVWTRTCPVEPQPGLFTTVKGWTDVYALFGREDPDNLELASAIRQDAVPAQYSGAAIVRSDGVLVVEGVAGEGDLFMLGERPSHALPEHIANDVAAAYEALQETFGPVRMEWVHDGTRVWIVQLHMGSTNSTAGEVVPGEATHWIEFNVRQGLSSLRKLLGDLPEGYGVSMIGEFGMTSHIADVLRKAGRPARYSPAAG